jgi:hypothetical protein
MMKIEVIGLEPPCEKCNELLDNAKKAVEELGIDEMRDKYGLLLSPALAIEGIVVAQGKVYKAERIKGLLQG